MRLHTALARLALVLLLAAGVSASRSAADPLPAERTEVPLGPVLGNLDYRGEIRYGPDGEDTDSFAGLLAAGERISLRVSAPSRSSLYPSISLIGPDGEAQRISVRSRRFGRLLDLRGWTVPETGVWTVRIGAVLETYGEYSARLTIGRPASVRTTVEPDATGVTPASVELPFAAVDGSLAAVRVTARPGTLPRIVSLRDPSGDDVRDASGALAVDRVQKRRGRLSLPPTPLDAGAGDYVVRVDAPAGHRGFDVAATVTPPPRPKGRRRLASDEPWMEDLAFPIRGTKDLAVRIRGRHFSTLERPVVLFGGVPGTEVEVEPFGTWLEVHPPLLEEGTTVAVAVVNPDLQAYERPGHFYYVPEPHVTDLVDADGLPVRGSGTRGGGTVLVLGSNFQTGVFLYFGGSGDVIPRIHSDTEMEVIVPPGPAGLVEVHVVDAYAHDVQPPFLFEYKGPPALDAQPYQPETAVGDGTGSMTLFGSGFERTDVVLFDGAEVTTFWISAYALTFTVPASSPGTHTVSVRDRFGSVADAPDLVVTAP